MIGGYCRNRGLCHPERSEGPLRPKERSLGLRPRDDSLVVTHRGRTAACARRGRSGRAQYLMGLSLGAISPEGGNLSSARHSESHVAFIRSCFARSTRGRRSNPYLTRVCAHSPSST